MKIWLVKLKPAPDIFLCAKSENPAAPGSFFSFLLCCIKSNLYSICAVLHLFKAESYELKAAFRSLRNKKVKTYIIKFAFFKNKTNAQPAIY